MKIGDPTSYGTIVAADGDRYFCRIVGTAQLVVWIEPAMGGLSAEWWTIQNRIAEFATVVAWDRAGYGWSTKPTRRRSPLNVASEMRAVMSALGLAGRPLILVGHSLGGLYVRAFLHAFPDAVKGMLLLDPMSPDDNRASELLTPEVYSKSGFDKTSAMAATQLLSSLSVLRLLKPWVLKSPPFHYYGNLVSGEAVEIIWRSMLKPSFFGTMLAEYRESHNPEHVTQLKSMRHATAAPLTVLYHDPTVLIDEIVKYGGLSPADAQRVEDVWREIVGEYLNVSTNSRFVEVPKASHYVHMAAPDVVVNRCREMAAP
jgi:pimeloyl-ACP methyl ester carboxylesterase